MKPADTRRLLPITLALFAPVTLAQGAAEMAVSPPKAGTATAEVSLQFNSTFAGYRPYSEQAVGSWREANDEVARIGGWRAYAKEAAQESGADSGTGAGHGNHQHPMRHGSEGGRP